MNGPEADGRWWPAPAKLNLFLLVTGRRPDGYHELQTLFQILDWGDEIHVRVTDDGRITRSRGGYGIPPKEDLALRAARHLQAVSGSARGATLEVRKRIPIGAGLGGGSSDAATVLVVLNRLWECGLSDDRLADLALDLGADVPVFVRGHTAIATGVGEKLEPVPLGERHYLLLMPDIRVSTAEIFADPGLRRDSEPIPLAEVLAGKGRNDCEPVVCRHFPELAEPLEALGQFGPARMSGTGSSMFVPMSSRGAATAAASELKCRYNVRAVGGLDASLLLQALR